VRGRTTFIITHSISDSILKLITRIVVLERGRVISTGAHADLLENCAAYRRLYQAQLRGATGDIGSDSTGVKAA
jgi:ABC-type multidrug transport system fused ATPase/permease subunit